MDIENQSRQHVDSIEELQAFIGKFSRSFGENAPTFISAGLGEAVRQAFLRPRVDRKPLAVYLHRDASPDGPRATPFCRDILTESTVRDLLTKDFIVWGWDLSKEANRDWLLHAVNAHLGSMACDLLNGLSTSDFPVLVTLIYGQVNVEVHSVISSSKSPVISRVLSELASTVSKNQEINVPGNSSLEETEAIDQLPSQIVVLLKFKLPLGNILQRRFWLDESFGAIVFFLNQEGYNLSNYKLIRFNSKKDMTGVSPDRKLFDLNFSPLEQFIIEERKHFRISSKS